MFGIIALASVASAYNASVPQDNATVTEHPTVYTTYCPEPTTFTRANMTYTVTEPTTLTITDCGTKQCGTPQKTAGPSSARNATNGTSTKSPENIGAGSSLKVGAAAAVVGAIAYLL